MSDETSTETPEIVITASEPAPAAPKLSRLQLAKQRLADRDKALDAAYDDQRAIDLEAALDLRERLGDTNVVFLDVPFTSGLPTLIAARTPKPSEVQRYQDRLKPGIGRKGEATRPDPVEAAKELCAVVRVYPDGDTWEKLLLARPGIPVQLGTAALGLAAASES